MAHWAFAFKYFFSALTMQGLFDKSKQLTERGKKCLDGVFWIVMVLNCLIPLAGYAFLWLGHWRVEMALINPNNKTEKVKYQFWYTVFSMMGGIL